MTWKLWNTTYQFTENYVELCTIQVDLSYVPLSCQSKFSGQRSYYFYVFKIILLFRLTELEAMAAWKENVSLLLVLTGGDHFYDKKVASACRWLCIMPHALMKYLILYRHYFITLMAGWFFIFHKFVRQFQNNFISLIDNFTWNFILLPGKFHNYFIYSSDDFIWQFHYFP